MSQERMELWSNDSLTEFAIKYNSIFEVTTSDDSEKMTMIDDCPYRSGYEVDWHYTLSQWVVYYLANKLSTLLESKVQKEFDIHNEDDNEIYSSYSVGLAIKVKNKLPPKPGLKCHFCNLKYSWKKNGSNTKNSGIVIKSSHSIARIQA